MPRFRVRLNDPDSDHFRVSYISADTPEEAAAKVQSTDARLVDDPEYPQAAPYDVVYVVERGQPIPLNKGGK